VQLSFCVISKVTTSARRRLDRNNTETQRHQYGTPKLLLFWPTSTFYVFTYFISVNMMGSQHA